MKTIVFAGLEWQILDEKTGLICTKEIINSESIVGEYVQRMELL